MQTREDRLVNGLCGLVVMNSVFVCLCEQGKQTVGGGTEGKDKLWP